MRRKNILSSGGIYHVYSKSIAGYKIFHTKNDYNRIIDLFKYYRIKNTGVKFSKFLEIRNMTIFIEKHWSSKDFLVEIIAYCIMPTHIHLVLKQLQEEGIVIFMGNILNSYSRFFNIRTSRKGPLWESRFKNVLVETDEQLLHLTRYVHLNPVTAGLVESAEEWRYSSIKEYLSKRKDLEGICDFDSSIELEKLNYKSFIDSQKNYQRELGKIKSLFLD